MQNQSEKRDFPRMVMDCPARYRLHGGSYVRTAIAKNLSGDGILLQVEKKVKPGSRLSVGIKPGKNGAPSFHMLVEVNRCVSVKSGFSLACTIDKMLPKEEIPLDFL